MDAVTDVQEKGPPSVVCVVVTLDVITSLFICALMVVSLDVVASFADINVLVVILDVVASSVVCAFSIISVNLLTSAVVGCWVFGVSVAVTTDNKMLFVILFTEVVVH